MTSSNKEIARLLQTLHLYNRKLKIVGSHEHIFHLISLIWNKSNRTTQKCDFKTFRWFRVNVKAHGGCKTRFINCACMNHINICWGEQQSHVYIHKHKANQLGIEALAPSNLTVFLQHFPSCLLNDQNMFCVQQQQASLYQFGLYIACCNKLRFLLDTDSEKSRASCAKHSHKQVVCQWTDCKLGKLWNFCISSELNIFPTCGKNQHNCSTWRCRLNHVPS